ncbi:MAG: hypothetical protein IIC09_07505 [Proteobacteria bacterium]|nr:hypothetical protein [Pseudomonadota bacterium]
MVKYASFRNTFTGHLLTLLLVFGIYQPTTALASESENIRIISARRAGRRERTDYEEGIE